MKRFDGSQRDYEMHIRNRARKLIDPVDTGHLTYGEAYAAALAISTQNDLRAEDPELTEAGAKAIGEVVADAIKRAESERAEAERRSEERRVGKECRARGEQDDVREKRVREERGT